MSPSELRELRELCAVCLAAKNICIELFGAGTLDTGTLQSCKRDSCLQETSARNCGADDLGAQVLANHIWDAWPQEMSLKTVWC